MKKKLRNDTCSPVKAEKLFILFLIIYELAVNLSNDMYLPAIPALTESFKMNSQFGQYTLTAWFAGAMLMNPILGILSDNLGRKKTLIVSGIIFLITSLYCAFATNHYLFLAARFLQGVTVTTVVVCGYALIHEIYDNKKAIIIIAWMSGALIVAPMLGPLIGGYIMHFSGWPFIFLYLALIAFIALLGLLVFMPNSKIVTLEKVNIAQEISAYRNIFLNPKFLLGSLVAAMLFAGLIAWIAASPFLILEVYRYSEVEFGLLQIPIFASFIAGTLFLKMLLWLNLQNEKIVYLGIVSVAIIAAGLIILMISDHLTFFMLVAMMSIYSFVYGVISSPLNRISVTSLPYGMGKIIAIFDFILGLAATIGTMTVNTQPKSIVNNIGIVLVIFSLLAWVFYFLKEKIKTYKIN